MHLWRIMPKLFVLAATSDIGRALCHQFAKNGFDLVLSSRDLSQVQKDANDYQLRYQVNTEVLILDVTDYWSHQKILKPYVDSCDGMISVAGYLGSQELAQSDWEECQQIIDVNFTGCVSVINLFAQAFEQKKEGFIIGISSVAGERGRQSNFFYGSAKAAFSTYLSGLRNRLAHSNVHVLTVKPGFVRTKMTEDKPLPAPLTAQPEQVAKDVFKAYMKKKNTVYTLWMWRYIMLIIKKIPESIFKKLKM